MQNVIIFKAMLERSSEKYLISKLDNFNNHYWRISPGGESSALGVWRPSRLHSC